MGKGRLFKFESTGETVFVPPISGINERQKLMREFPPPEPPMVKVNYGDGDVWEPNPLSQEYREALDRHEEMLNQEMTVRVLRRIAIKQKISDEQRKAAQAYREEMSEFEQVHPTDKLVWFYEFALGDDKETLELMKIATGQKDPQEEGVSLETDNFRSAVQGNGHLEVTHQEGALQDTES